MTRLIECACGDVVPAAIPFLELVRWVWRHRRHRRAAA